MIEMGKKYENKLGYAVKILGIDLKNDDFPVYGIVTDCTGHEAIEKWTKEGHWYADRPRTPCADDLVEVTA